MNNPPLYILGLDLGQQNDFTALCVLERTQVGTGKVEVEHGPVSHSSHSGFHVQITENPVHENHFVARHLERLPIGTAYPAQVARIKELHDRLKTEAKEAPLLVVDQTGVGRPVVDMLRAAELKPVAVTITGGDTASRDGLDYRVPKKDLVSAVAVLLETDRLKIVPSLREAQTLIAELQAFKVSINLKGNDSYGNDVGQWRENPHDDLVLAVALAAWYGEHYKPVVDNSPPSLSFRGSRYSGRR